MAFSKLKVILRKAAARSIDELWQVIAEALDMNRNKLKPLWKFLHYTWCRL